jgi:hypothetical protein
MCSVQGWIAGAAAAVTLIGSQQQAVAAGRAAEADADDMEYQAALSRDQGQAEAQRIRREGRRQRGSTVAAVAASGVKVGEGSALDAERTVMQDYEQDAAIAILNGERQGDVLDRRARGRRRAGGTQGMASMLGGVGSLLGQGGSFFGGS